MNNERTMILVAAIFMSCLIITVSVINSTYEREDMASILDHTIANHTLLLQQSITLDSLRVELKELKRTNRNLSNNVEIGLLDFLNSESLSLLKLENTDE